MYLKKITIENFRIFGSKDNNKHLELELSNGLNIFVGENDSGKSAIIDAIRHVLWTTSQEYYRLSEDDFHISSEGRAEQISIQLVFEDLSTPEVSRYIEWISMENDTPCVYVTLKATKLQPSRDTIRRGRNISATVRAGKNADGPPIEGTIREFLKTTYLKPLRDAEGELSPGRGSRLSQILQSHPEFDAQKESDFQEDNPHNQPSTLRGIMHQAEYHIENNEVITSTQNTLNNDYLRDFSIGDEAISGVIGIARQAELRHILEKLELSIAPPAKVTEKTRRGDDVRFEKTARGATR